MRNFTFTLILSILAIAQLNAQNVNIPDANFKSYLIANAGINTNSDTEIQLSEAQSFSGTLDCSSLSIADLTGIESFVSLTELNCSDNQLTTLDVSNNTALTTLQCDTNQLTNIDLTNLLSLENFRCMDNQINDLDVTNNTGLLYLECSGNNLLSIDVSNNPLLSQLTIYDNQLSTIDASNNIDLRVLMCHNNQLNSLNLQNGNNTIFLIINTFGNPNLTCVEVDDSIYSTNNWQGLFFIIDPITSFSEDCDYLGLEVNTLIELNVFPNPTKDIITIASDSKIISSSVFDLAGNLVDTFIGKKYSTLNLKSGIYFIKVETTQGIAQQKLVKY